VFTLKNKKNKMFQLKNGSGSAEPSLANKLPNFHGKVRTFKEDSENLEKGISNQSASAEEDFSSPSPIAAEKNISLQQRPLASEEPTQSQPTYSKNEAQAENPFQSMPTPAPTSSLEPDLSALKPSQSFFSEKPTSSENTFAPQTETNPLPQKSKKMMFVSLSVLLVAIVAAAGFYYYWFFIKKAAPATPAVPEISVPETESNPAVVTPQDNNLRKIIVDTSQSPTAVKIAVTTFATNFVSSASEGNLVEVKAIDQTNQPIGKNNFFAGLGITVPETVAMKLSEDYSLFVKKEAGTAKLGLVFKTITSASLSEEMKGWEPSMFSDLSPIFIGQTPTGARSFNSSRYKNADIRYFNFSSPADTSLDYSVIANFLVIGTSKDTTRGILDYMSQK
jgi:hypothetical protein